MNTIRPLSLALAICTASLAPAIAQDAPENVPGERPSGPPPFAQMLPEAYAKLAAFDADSNQELDVDELAQLATAITEGELKRPDWLPTPPRRVDIPVEAIVLKLGEFYASLAPYDADNDGQLEEGEREGVRDAIFSGELKHPIQLFREALPSEGRRPWGRPRFGGRR